LQQVSPKESALALQAIQRLMDASLSFSNTLFQAVICVESNEELHAQIAQLRQLLSTDTTVIPQIKQSIMQTLHRLQQPLMNATNTALMSQSFMTLLSEDASGEMKFTALQLLKEGQLLPQQASLHNVEEQLTADRKSTRLNSSHVSNSYAVFCLKKNFTNDSRYLIVSSTYHS